MSFDPLEQRGFRSRSALSSIRAGVLINEGCHAGWLRLGYPVTHPVEHLEPVRPFDVLGSPFSRRPAESWVVRAPHVHRRDADGR